MNNGKTSITSVNGGTHLFPNALGNFPNDAQRNNGNWSNPVPASLLIGVIS